MACMKLPPKLANWLSARRRAHERHVAEQIRMMSKVDMAPRIGRTVRVPPPPGGYQGRGGKQSGAGRAKNRGR
jgi:hypothetical protein